MRYGLLTLGVLLLAGCLTEAQQFAGAGPITLSPPASKALEWHMMQGKGDFVVSLNGVHHVESDCVSVECDSQSLLDIIQRCERVSGRSCRLFAQDGEVVWQGSWKTSGKAKTSR